MTKSWPQALVQWNKDKPQWMIPKRGSAEYNQVVSIMRGETNQDQPVNREKRSRDEDNEPRRSKRQRKEVERLDL